MSKYNYNHRNRGYNDYAKRNGRRRGGRNSFHGSKIDPKKYVSSAEAGPSCSIYQDDCKFEDFNVASVIQSNIRAKNFSQPTKIQAQAIPYVLSGKDILGLAGTGSGKTAAFLVPMIDKALKDRGQKILIVTPTRELAAQIRDEFVTFSKGTNLRSAVVIGGASMGKQISVLKQNPQFVIATPGRLKDLSQRGVIHFDVFNNIVLDEVDRMLDMGFVHEIKQVISKLSQNKQSMFFSATMNPKIEEIARSLLRDPVKIQVERLSLKRNVEQNVVKVRPEEKIEKLHDLLNGEDFHKVLIFSRTKYGSDKLSKTLLKRGFCVDSIHGGKTQSRRERVIRKFRQDEIKILVATDVAARGLDIDDITHVINYDEPNCYDDYIHRIGRTGRAGKKGNALTFVG
ncbi:DEAD/DEAH box helicase [Candidatus Dojkabacteria bacterium]|nr:DEAD/DEAH box helicase [Candidatus Dojkabacteria bacterium]